MEEKINQLLKKENYDINDLEDVIHILRSENGCPWDKVQTHKSIKMDFLEEVYEVLEAIDADSSEMLREELGDVLLQVMFHSVIEIENGNFTFDDVVGDVCKKLIVRHPHVFGSVNADNVDEVLKNWDAIKKETKGQETYTDTLKSVPKNFPALMRAQKLAKRSSRAKETFNGSDSRYNAWESINREVNDLHETIDCGSADEQAAALGNLMFVCCNMARTLGIEAEEILSDANERFIQRFEDAEKISIENGKNMSELNDYDELWRK